MCVLKSDSILTTDRRVIRFLTSSPSNLYLNSVERSVILNHSNTYTRSAKMFIEERIVSLD